jgi:hypothetical protein
MITIQTHRLYLVYSEVKSGVWKLFFPQRFLTKLDASVAGLAYNDFLDSINEPRLKFRVFRTWWGSREIPDDWQTLYSPAVHNSLSEHAYTEYLGKKVVQPTAYYAVNHSERTISNGVHSDRESASRWSVDSNGGIHHNTVPMSCKEILEIPYLIDYVIVSCVWDLWNDEWEEPSKPEFAFKPEHSERVITAM